MRKNELKRASASVLCICGLALGASAAQYYIAPDGDDKNDGSAAKPLKTLERALYLTRQIEREEEKEIIFKDGYYTFQKPVVFRRTDYDITIRAEHSRKAVLSGTMKIGGWHQDETDKRLLVADLPFQPEVGAGYLMTCNGAGCPIAAYPKSGRMRYKGGGDMVGIEEGTFPADVDLTKLDFKSVWLEFPQEWGTTITKIRDYDEATRTFTIAASLGSRFNQGFMMFNCRFGLTRPGQWMYAVADRKVYYYPREGETAETIDCRMATAGLIMAVHTQGMKISGLVFEGCVASFEKRGRGNPYSDAPWVATLFLGCDSRNVIVEDCEARHTAGNGFFATKPVNSVFRNCYVHDVGGGGISVFDGGSNCTVINCEVANFGQSSTASSGITVQQPRGHCVSNHVHHGSGCGVTMWSSRSLFASNHIHHVMLSQRDGGGLYGGMTDGLILDNYVHDIGWPGLYIDEGSQRTVYRGNVFERCGWPFHAHCSSEIVVSNNVIRGCGGYRLSFQGSGHCTFCDNKLWFEGPQASFDPYLVSCDFWGRNEIFEKQPDGTYKSRMLTLERIKSATNGVMRVGYFDSFKTQVFKKKDETGFDAFFVSQKLFCGTGEDGYPNIGVPFGFVQAAFDDEYLYFWFTRGWNKLKPYYAMKNLTSVGWRHSDANRVDFEGGRHLIVFPDGSFESKGVKVTANDVKVTGAGECVFRIPLNSLNIAGAKKKPPRLNLEQEETVFDNLLTEDVIAGPTAEERNLPPSTEVSGLKIGFNAAIWTEDKREMKSLWSVAKDNYATGTLTFARTDGKKGR